ncbi:hypothetical protein AVEN_88838-1 [Araneus ventricosus]|uniref:Reverse transcriptase domain-containing protein n=1 Tax=Araneus ventricosus TaxID=182803 RepID=A0A4Y2HSV4_ARAVE|nr:hypothetical protein AVEN_88838-1 [Araneus ventricosus]
MRTRFMFRNSQSPMLRNLVANEIISEEWQPNVHLQAFVDEFIFVISAPTEAKLKATTQATLTKFQHWTDKHQLKRKFLLNITEVYSTTPQAALQVREGMILLHINKNRKQSASEEPDYTKLLITTTSTSTPITMRTTQHPPNSAQQVFN